MAREPRTVEAKISTQRYLLTLFILQLDAYDEHMKSAEAMKAKAIKSGKFDPTIIDRIDMLREGHATTLERIADLEEQIASQPEPETP